MKKMLLVMRQELILTFKRPTYLLFALGIPALVILIFLGMQYFHKRSGSAEAPARDVSQGPDIKVEGFVDYSGLVKVIPATFPSGRLLAYPSETVAQQALATAEITAYYVISKKYLAEGEILYIYPKDKSLISDGQDWVMRWTILVNLLKGDVNEADAIWNPVWNMEIQNI